MASNMDIELKMLNKIRANRYIQEQNALDVLGKPKAREYDNMVTRAKILMEESVIRQSLKESESFTIKKSTPQFGDLRTSQEESVKKTVGGNVKFGDDALKFHMGEDSDDDDLTLEGKIPSLNLSFQFRYNDPSGDGLFIWSDALQLTDENLRTIGKIRDAFNNWKDSITQDDDLLTSIRRLSQEN